MNVLLVAPPVSPKIETLTAIKMIAPPMGLAYLAAVLEEAHCPVEILDSPPLRITLNQLPKELERRKPDLVGVTATTATVTEALRTAEIAKKALPGSTVALGGAHITFTPERTMKEYPFIDIGVIGEGEETVLELVQALEQDRALKQVKGIIYRNDGQLVRTPPRPYIENLDTLPYPARHLLPMNRYGVFGKKHVLGAILTSRGCPFNCTFCSSSLLFGKKFRARSPKNVVDEIEQFKETYKTPYVEIIDDTFMLDKKRAEAICKELVDRKLDVTWACSSRVDLLTQHLMAKLKKAGCGLLYYGAESGAQRVLNLMKKGIKLEQTIRVSRWSKELKLQTIASFVIGLLEETWSEAIETIQFAKKLDPDYVQFSIATPFPGTELYDTAKRERLLLTEDWSEYTVLKPVMRTRELSTEQLRKLIKKAYLSFYFRPKPIFRYIRQGHTKELIINVIGKYLWRYVKNKISREEGAASPFMLSEETSSS